MRIIKQYPNRKFYDTLEHSYINITRINELVIDNTEFKVLDARSHADITHHTLIKAYAEAITSNPHLLLLEEIKQLIKKL